MGQHVKFSERKLIALVDRGEWQIDEDGRIWRTCIRVGLKSGGSRLVPVKRRRAEHRLPTGYLQVRATVDGHRVHGGAHRLVWQHFKGDIPSGHEINHRNGIKDDNRPNNLECGTPGANATHKYRSGLQAQYGEKNPAAKLSDGEVAQIRLAYDQGGYTMQQLADRFGIRFQHVSRLVRGERRPQQGGPTTGKDHRHSASDRDPKTGRFISPASTDLQIREFPT